MKVICIDISIIQDEEMCVRFLKRVIYYLINKRVGIKIKIQIIIVVLSYERNSLITYLHTKFFTIRLTSENTVYFKSKIRHIDYIILSTYYFTNTN